MGLTMPQARQLKEWIDNLWVLLDQDDFNKIVEIFSNAIDRAEQEYEESEEQMKSYQWWRKQKKRVQKKYTLLLGRYLTPKELREWYNHRTGRK